jgi:ATP-dependent phosphofructokinase / diphosphate-dependent phosphofructokinase
MSKTIGILTSGGDCPGLNAAIRGVAKAAINMHDWTVIGFVNGFRGLMENRTMQLTHETMSGILTRGGTILGTSRDKPHKMPVGGKTLDMTDAMVETYHKHHLEALVCLGGGGTAKNAYRLAQKGLNVLTLPKTIDNDITGTDISFGYDTALAIATDAIDRLHSTAHSHHRIIVVETMGHNTGWIGLGAGLAGGADVILLPEIPYDTEIVAEAIRDRSRSGRSFSIVAVSEGAMPKKMAKAYQQALEQVEKAEKNKNEKAEAKADAVLAEVEAQRKGATLRLAEQLEKLTGLEARVTILGYVQRGGTPSAADRLLATRLGTAAIDCIDKKRFGMLIASRGDGAEAVPLKDIIGKPKLVPPDHEWVRAARRIGVCLGDKAPMRED